MLMAEEHSFVDFTIERPGEGIRLLVEARNVSAPSREWAGRFLRNLFAHAQIPPADYFLLALRDHLYLWRRPSADAAAPDFEGDTASALRPYLKGIQVPLDKLSKSSFELLIQAWLNDLVGGTLPESAELEWLEKSGLADSVRDGSIHANIAA
jgi:hypothetical protein